MLADAIQCQVLLHVVFNVFLHVLPLKLLSAACIAKVTFNYLQTAHIQVVF